MWTYFFIPFLLSVTLFADGFQEVVLYSRTMLSLDLMQVSFQKRDNTPFALSPGDYIELKYPGHWQTRMYSVSAITENRLLITITVRISPHRHIHRHVSEEMSTAKVLSQSCLIKAIPTGIWQKLQENPDAPLVIIAGGLACSRGESIVRALGGNDCSRKIFFIHSIKSNLAILGHSGFITNLEYYIQYETAEGVDRVHQGKPAILEQFLFPEALYLISGPDRTKKALGSFEKDIQEWLIKKAQVPEENIILSTFSQQ